MTHDMFGKLKYKARDESWAATATLPRFAAIGMMPEPPEMSEDELAQMTDELNETMENMKKMMRDRFGPGVEAAFAEMEREADEAEREALEGSPDPKQEERERRAAERRAKNSALLAKGKFPVRIAAPDEAEPTPAQAAAFRFLLDNEQAVFDAVREQVWDSFQNAYDDEHWRRITRLQPAASADELKDRFAITRVDISRGARAGFAHLTFLVESEWEDEHGLLVVYSPDTRSATWTTWDGLYDLLESDEPEDAGEEYVPTPHDELLEAILTGDEAKARELVATGADINALGPDEYPPLWLAVEHMEVEEVRRLLAFGADSSLANPDEKTTPLKHAKKMYRDMGFAPSKNRDAMMDGILSMMKEVAGGQLNEIKGRLEEIIKLLEDVAKR